MIMNIETIALDADDTLWVNEPYFQATEKEFCALLKDIMPEDKISAELLKTEMKNLELYGYGIKGFMLSMIETLYKITDAKTDIKLVRKVIDLGHDLIQQPVELIEGVEDTLEKLSKKYKLVLATKGDLLDQERKLKASKLGKWFVHIEVMSHKTPDNFRKLIRHLEILPKNFLMVGNSIQSDIIPVLEINSYAAHIPYSITWNHEKHEKELEHPNLLKLEKIEDLLNHLL
ncbi:MAG: HAD family hydrolase [Zunongwangia sp.]|uniref:HAD family hydrolase n=2 Tax=Zunongwangia profunda TaxID=398743 RepID=A0A3D5IYQ8_9FLAO|nr:HAD family hydrolase [Zunongwangia profunda]MAC64967.1 HAD family hydrolase [Flavobacteriaceae bacterium]MAO38534.1 HAD family hydrolase [Zunongwangia sp.]MAG86506.1 HAD family hydrolase [Flavobacteriaceae bacterium]MAS71854.1 HAD family hydrolase [Zunongwangia sp.]HAJ81478.1 HAD family hydrolase [Zunongwangia profunda]|tara:strand:+ start:713 stop:1405 length:693 start_codon:yes stop_codon:yes gene_type:complete